jgi:hypothetical protein
MSEPTLHPVPPLEGDLPSVNGDYEYRVLTVPRGASRSEVRRMLADLAERDHWELAKVRLSFGGGRRIWLRRRIIRVVRTA